MPEPAETERVAVIGAGPAGSLLALALLQAAAAQGRKLTVHLYGASSLRCPDAPLVAEGLAIARLAAWGIPLPAGRAIRSQRVWAPGLECKEGSHALSLPRSTLLAILRAAAASRGAILVPHQVEALQRLPGGGWRLRVQGAPARAEQVVLACGAGAQLATQIPGHQPPPSWRSSATPLRAAASSTLSCLLGDGESPNLWVLPTLEGLWVEAVGQRLASRELGSALLHAYLGGGLEARAAPGRWLHRSVPAGLARPGLPTVGAALGGPPEGPPLAQVIVQAQACANALLEGGEVQALRASRQQLRLLAPALRRSLSARKQLQRFRPAAQQRVLRREAARPPQKRSLVQLLLPGEVPPSWRRLIRLLLALSLATLALLWARLRRPKAARPSQGRELFIVEDEAAQAEGLAAWLEERGFTCRIFGDALQAAAAASEEAPAAVLADLSLPWVDGAALCKALKAGSPSTPILLISALPSALALASAKEAGADAFFGKPLDPEALLDALRRLSPAPPPGVARGSPSRRQPSSG